MFRHLGYATLALIVWANGAVAQDISVVTAPGDIKRLTNDLQRELNAISPSAKIQSCSPMVHEFVGKGDEIYGGFCTALINGKTKKLMMCADHYVAKFTVSLGYEWYAGNGPFNLVSEFMNTSCPVGG